MGYDDHGGNDYNDDYNNDNIDDYGGDAGMDTGMPDAPPPESPTRPGIKAEGAEEPVSTSKAEAATAARGNVSDSAEAPTPTANRTVQQLVRCCPTNVLHLAFCLLQCEIPGWNHDPEIETSSNEWLLTASQQS